MRSFTALRIAVAACIVLALAVVGLVARVLVLQDEVAGLEPRVPSQSPPTVIHGSPSSQPSNTSQPSTTSPPASLPPGADELEGAIWYPPTSGAGSIVVAPVGSTASADITVEGSADDEINGALGSLSGEDGGQVTLLPGRYEVADSIVIDGDGLSLVGSNVGNGAGYSESALGSMIVPSDAFPDGAFVIRTTPEAYGPLISLLHVDGLDRAQGINVESRRPTVTLNAVTQATDTGIRFGGESTGNRPYDGYVLFNRVFDGGGIGILHDQRSGDMLIEGNVVFRNEDDGFRCFGASQMYRVNHAYNNGGVGLRIIPGCVRTRLSSNKWEGNASGGLSIEGGSGFTILGDTFAHNEADQADPPSHIELGTRGTDQTVGVMMWGLSFGKGSDDNAHLIHVGPLAREVHVGPIHDAGGSEGEPYRVDPGGELNFYDTVPDLVLE